MLQLHGAESIFKTKIPSVIEEIPRIAWSQVFHCLVHQGHRLVPIMNQTYPIHNLQPYSFKLRFNIILRSVASNLRAKALYSFFLSLCLPHAPFPHPTLLDLIAILHYFSPKRRWLLMFYTNKSFTSQNNQYSDMNNEPGNDFLHRWEPVQC